MRIGSVAFASFGLLEDTMGFGLEGIVTFALVGQECDRVLDGRDCREFKVDEFHVFHAAKADRRHQRLEQDAGGGISNLERSNKRAVEDFKLRKAT
jgi:hypothetical protein